VLGLLAVYLDKKSPLFLPVANHITKALICDLQWPSSLNLSALERWSGTTE